VTTGINDYKGMNISIAPNPAHDYVMVTVKDLHKEMMIELLDMCGRVLRTMRLTAEDSMLRVERGNLLDGIYMLRMTSNGQIQTRKVIFR
jgi:hypothetical protein